MIPVVLQIALSSIGSCGEWEEQNFEESSFWSHLGRVGGVTHELDDSQISQYLRGCPSFNEGIDSQRCKLVRRVLYRPISPDKGKKCSKDFILSLF